MSVAINAIIGAATLFAVSVGAAQESVPPLPMAVTNNAVAIDTPGGRVVIYSFMGIDSTKRWDGVTTRSFGFEVGSRDWEELPPVPGSPGRLAATAVALHGKVYLFGGYTVARDGSEKSLATVDIYHPTTRTWSSGAPIPLPVDDAVSGVWRDSLIYLVSGWHDNDNVSAVQLYDPRTDTWNTATEFPGTPVFGHAGGIVGDHIVIIDGVANSRERPRYRLVEQSWLGTINPSDPTQISWRRVNGPPGGPRYRAAAGSCGNRLIIAGGTDNPYNYNGLGYNGVPSEPLGDGWLLDPGTGRWDPLPPTVPPSMDHRGLLTARGRLFIVGGMGPGGRVRRETTSAALPQGC